MTTPPPEEEAPGARLMLGVLVVVYIFNFLDRQILSILAERIKADLGVTDAQMGYLYGTAFAVFYAIFGIPLGRLADVWDRRRLIAWGLAAWSAMTALSGFARSFGQLALARVGVGVGEASASPAAYSLLSDLFPKRRRATALAIYSSGIYLGSGLGLGIGGLIVERWDRAYPGASPFGLEGWQVAFVAVGLPGLLLALVVRALPEPARGRFDSATPASGVTSEPHPFRAFFAELMSVIPPLTLLNLWQRGARGALLGRNLLAGAGCAVLATLLTRALGNPAQWISLGMGAYGAISWAQALRLRDRPAHELIFRTRSLQAANLGVALQSFNAYGFGFWVAPYLIREHGAKLSEIGLLLGGIAAAAGWLGVTFGGVLADRWQRRSPLGRLRVTTVSALAPLPFAVALLYAPNLTWALVAALPFYVTSSLWIGPGVSIVQDLVQPRMRALASANYLVLVTFIGLALGPYTAGRLSVAFGGLRPALLCCLVVNLFAFALALYAARHLEKDEATKDERAAAAVG